MEKPSPLKLLSKQEIIIPLKGGMTAPIANKYVKDEITNIAIILWHAMVIEIIDATAIDIITKVIEFLFTYPPNLEHTTPPNTIPNVGPNKHKDPKKINLTESSISKTNFIYLSPKY